MSTPTVIVIGGSGQVGRVHLRNFQDLGADVYCYDFFPIPEEDLAEKIKFYNAKEIGLKDCFEKVGKEIDAVVVAVPDNFLVEQMMSLLKLCESGRKVKKVLVEKPGALTAKEFQSVLDYAKKNNVNVFIDYQRSFHPKLAQLLKNLKKYKDDGFKLDYFSCHSYDRAQPPQKSHQAINQGCHDYAILLAVLDSLGQKPDLETITCLGVKWNSLNDTKLLKINGTTSEGAIFDVQIGRVSKLGTYSEIICQLSRYNSKNDMYEPVEERLRFPDSIIPEASWKDTWKESFVESARALLNEKDHVRGEFGVSVLEFAENVMKKID